MAFSVPSLKRTCVIKIVKEIKEFCYGSRFEDLGKWKYIVGPFENASSQSIEAIFEYVISTRQLSPSWLSLLIVTHLRTINFKQFPGGVNPQLFKILLNRCQLLERLIIPNCKKIPNRTLSDLLIQNPSLLELDISNKVSPKVDVSIVNTLARSCRYLTVLKLSDYRVNDPRTLLVLCGRKIVEKPQIPESNSAIHNAPSNSTDTSDDAAFYPEEHAVNGNVSSARVPSDVCQFCGKKKAPLYSSQMAPGPSAVVSDFPMELENLEDQLSCLHVPSLDCSVSLETADHECEHLPTMEAVSIDRPSQLCECVVDDIEEGTSHPMEENGSSQLEATREEQENQRVGDRQVQNLEDDNVADMPTEESDEDLYEDDGILTALNIEDHSSEYGCLDLETLWLDNVNITDPVMAVLLQYLPRLRDLNLSDTDICNPWRLLDPSCCTHLIELEDLDIKSTALSRTALEMIPKFHPDLHKFAISSTTLPPHTYANIGRLTGVADLELIGGQFYPCEPKEIFDKGIAPAICGIGKHLRSLNLTYFAHVEFEVIPRSCPKLEHLDLSFTSTTFWYPCDSLGDYCPLLKTLNLAFCHIEASEGRVENPQPVTQSKALQKMIGQPLNLVELNISGSAVSDETLKSIFPRAVHPLQVLDLSRCSMATIRGVEYIWSKCPFLHKIDLTYCKEITVDNSNKFEKKCFEERPLFKLEGKLVWK